MPYFEISKAVFGLGDPIAENKNTLLNLRNTDQLNKPPMVARLLPLICLVLATPAKAQQVAVLTPTRDVPFSFHDNFPTASTNYNSALHFSAFSQTGNIGGENAGRALIDFDLSFIPQDSTIFGAFLSVSAIGPYGVGEVVSIGHIGQNECTLERVTSSWGESTVTWNNQPTTTTMNLIIVPSSSYALQNYPSINVTELIRDIHSDPNPSNGLMLKLISENPNTGLAFFGSLAPLPDKRPMLTVIYGDCKTSRVGINDNDKDEIVLNITPSISSAGSVVRLDMLSDLNAVCSAEMIDASGRPVETFLIDRWPHYRTIPQVASGLYSYRIRKGGEALGAVRLVVP